MPLRGTPQEKVRQVMHEYKHGELHSGSKRGPRVTSRRQAIAIAMNQSRQSGRSRSRGRRTSRR
jgi:hypothetical protein